MRDCRAVRHSSFWALGIIPSMQPSHAISDLHFAASRLGLKRLDGAYAWQSFIKAGSIIPGGSDAPVERGDPMVEFYAAVAQGFERIFRRRLAPRAGSFSPTSTPNVYVVGCLCCVRREFSRHARAGQVCRFYSADQRYHADFRGRDSRHHMRNDNHQRRCSIRFQQTMTNSGL